MELFYKRPLLLALSAFLAAALAAAQIDKTLREVLLTLSCSMLLILPILLFRYKKQSELCGRLLSLCLCTLAVAGSLLLSHLFFDRTLKRLSSSDSPVSAIVEVETCDFSAVYQSQYTVRVREWNGKKDAFKAELQFSQNTGWKSGDVLNISAAVTPFPENIYGYNELRGKLSKGVLLCLSAENATFIENRYNAPENLFVRLRDKLSARMDSLKFDHAAPLLKAMLLGKTEQLESGVKLDFRRLGISHVLAISGLHFTTLLGMVILLMNLLGFNRTHSYILLIPLSVLYIGITGFSVSVCRA